MTGPQLPAPLVPAEVEEMPTSRARAVEIGAVRYFSDKPCPAGHVAARYTLNGYCVECQRIATQNNKLALKVKRRMA